MSAVAERDQPRAIEYAEAAHRKMLRWLLDDKEKFDAFLLKHDVCVCEVRGSYVIHIPFNAFTQVFLRTIERRKEPLTFNRLCKLLTQSCRVRVEFIPYGKAMEKAAPSWLIYERVKKYDLASEAVVSFVYHFDDEENGVDTIAFAASLRTADGLIIDDDARQEVGLFDDAPTNVCVVSNDDSLCDFVETL